MACGSGKLISDMVTGQRPDISTAGLGIDRYAGKAVRGLRASPEAAPA